jgi:hypothetical protein
MGVLDDAIREHLELKKRHGASEDEIARKEAEALGPARRGPAPAEYGDPPPADAEPAAAGPADPYEVADPPLEDAPPPAEADLEATGGASMADAATALGEGLPADAVAEAEPAPEPEPEPEVPVAHTEPVPAGEELQEPPVEPTIDVPAEVEPPAAIDPPGEPIEAAHPPVHEVDRDPLEPPAPIPSEGTVEFDTLAHREDDEPAAEPSDEDVLEETPEFLRETPEHDRLWFEQKPPRDFDLDN